MADELETLYSYLLRAKVAIDPLAGTRDRRHYRNSYSKMLERYRQNLLALHAASGAAQ